MRTLLALTVVVCAPCTARADDDATFVTLDREDGVSRAGTEVSFVALDDYGDGVAQSAMRFDTHAQSVNLRTGFGAYASIPVTVYSQSGASASGALGNIELGGLFARPLRPGLDVIVHAGLVLPSSPPGDDNTSELAQPSRLTDALLGQSPPVALRLAGAMRYRHDRLFARVDLGLDQSFVRFDALDYSVGLRVASAIGWDLGVALPAVELVGLFYDPSTSRTTITAALSVRARVSRVQPYAALIIPFQDRYFAAALTLGVDVVLP
jgi:hypothetical protein